MQLGENKQAFHPSPSGGGHICSRCGWPFPNPHPSAKQRRSHKKHCGEMEGYPLVKSDGAQVEGAARGSDGEELTDEDDHKSSSKSLDGSDPPHHKDVQVADACSAIEQLENGFQLENNTLFSNLSHDILNKKAASLIVERTAHGDSSFHSVTDSSSSDDSVKKIDLYSGQFLLDSSLDAILPETENNYSKSDLDIISPAASTFESEPSVRLPPVGLTKANGTVIETVPNEFAVNLEKLDLESYLVQEKTNESGLQEVDSALTAYPCPSEIDIINHVDTCSDPALVDAPSDFANSNVKGKIDEDLPADPTNNNIRIAGMDQEDSWYPGPMEPDAPIIDVGCEAFDSPEDHLKVPELENFQSEIMPIELGGSIVGLLSLLQVKLDNSLTEETEKKKEIVELNSGHAIDVDGGLLMSSVQLEENKIDCSFSDKASGQDISQGIMPEYLTKAALHEGSKPSEAGSLVTEAYSSEIGGRRSNSEHMEVDCCDTVGEASGSDPGSQATETIKTESDGPDPANGEAEISCSDTVGCCSLGAKNNGSQGDKSVNPESTGNMGSFAIEVIRTETGAQDSNPENTEIDCCDTFEEASRISDSGNQPTAIIKLKSDSHDSASEETEISCSNIVGGCGQEVKENGSWTGTDSNPESTSDTDEEMTHNHKDIGVNELQKNQEPSIAVSTLGTSTNNAIKINDNNHDFLHEEFWINHDVIEQFFNGEDTYEYSQPGIDTTTTPVNISEVKPQTHENIGESESIRDLNLTGKALLENSAGFIGVAKNTSQSGNLCQMISNHLDQDGENFQESSIQSAIQIDNSHNLKPADVHTANSETATDFFKCQVGGGNYESRFHAIEDRSPSSMSIQAFLQNSDSMGESSNSVFSEGVVSTIPRQPLEAGNDDVLKTQLSEAAPTVLHNKVDYFTLADNTKGHQSSVSDGRLPSMRDQMHLLSTHGMKDPQGVITQTSEAHGFDSVRGIDGISRVNNGNLFQKVSSTTLARLIVSTEDQPTKSTDQFNCSTFEEGCSPLPKSKQECPGRKKNEESIMEFSNWSPEKAYTPLKSLLVEANLQSKQGGPNAQEHGMSPRKELFAARDEDHVPKTPTRKIATQPDTRRVVQKEWNSPARLPRSKKGKEKPRGSPGKSQWVPFMCCSYVNKI